MRIDAKYQARIDVKILNLKNQTMIDYNYKVKYKVFTRNKQANKYETPYEGQYKSTQTWNNVMVTFKMGEFS